MKTRNLESSLLAVAIVTAFAFMAGKVVAQDSTTASAPPAVASQPATQLSYGVPQVLQLVQAKIGDSVIVNYIQSSGTIYSLTAGEIVYLKQAGVSDNVLNAMLNQRGRVAGSTEPAPAMASASAPVNSTPANSDQNYAAAAAPPVTYVQQAAQPSTVYVVPNTQTYYYSYPYYSYPYYGGYYYGWPAISLSFGWGNYRYNGRSYYYHGGYYGGWHGSSGGSWHGGGGHH